MTGDTLTVRVCCAALVRRERYENGKHVGVTYATCGEPAPFVVIFGTNMRARVDLQFRCAKHLSDSPYEAAPLVQAFRALLREPKPRGRR